MPFSTDTTAARSADKLSYFHSAVRTWFAEAFREPTAAQREAWPVIARGDHTLLLAPTGSGKTLAAFLIAINRLMFGPAEADAGPGVRVLYISPLKALGVDVERNLRAPLAGIRKVAEREGHAFQLPSVGVRSGDTSPQERSRLVRQPPEILITTPESLYLLLTSRARDILGTVEQIIVDEIHSLVPSKRGSHLFVSLERLEQYRRESQAPAATGAARERSSPSPYRAAQRIGLSATQRPLDEVARLLGGGDAPANPDEPVRVRRVEIVEAGRRKPLELRVEVPVEDMARLADAELPSGPAAGPAIPSIWPAIHPRLVELIRQHRSTMVFTNSRRLAERLAAAINEVAGEDLAAAHHGSIAKETRLLIEDRLKRGQLPAIVATSSLELGIDMGAVDLVIQIESPPSIASGIQRIGRAGHQVDSASRGIIFPKYRGDLLACSAAVARMVQGEVEETFFPRNPLDVLAQQVVAAVALQPRRVDDLYRMVRGAAPFHELPRSAFESVLDLLSGRYPSNEFSELRARVNWDRIEGTVAPRRGTQRLAIANGGTIPDRGLYGVFLASGGEGSGTGRVGELDEEMVFETRPGDVFLLGASSWRVVDISHDRVSVVPAPGEPGRMPFWRGDGPGRPLEFGQAIGALARKLSRMDRDEAIELLQAAHALDRRAADNLWEYLRQQREATGEVPSERTIVVESFVDEVGDWRIAILSPFGARVHAPWAMAVAARLRAETAGEVDLMWSDDGIVFRLPESDESPPLERFFPASDEVEDTVVRELGSTALFAARFRENAARALLLPKRQPGKRTPLWLQRRRAADLLSVAAGYEGFPILLETYRECLRDVFYLPGLRRILEDVERRVIRVHEVRTQVPSPFAASLLFAYTANFLYEGDAPLAERRAQTLALDHAQLRELLGDAELRELLDADVVDQLSLELQHLNNERSWRSEDDVHDALRTLGDLSTDELASRSGGIEADVLAGWLDELLRHRRVVATTVAGESRWMAAEDAGRYRDALGVVPPPGLPSAFLEEMPDALADLVLRFAKTHVPFRAEDVGTRFGLGIATVRAALERLLARDRVLEGEFLPGGRGREWCAPEVLRLLKRRSMARLRQQVEAVEPHVFARFLGKWQGVGNASRRGLDGLLDVIEQLQGVPLPASVWESEVLPARVAAYSPQQLDELCMAGEVVWRGFESLGTHDGRIALYLTDRAGLLSPPELHTADDIERSIRKLLRERGALFFDGLHRELGGFRNELLETLWRMVWAGQVTNDTLAPLRSLAGSVQAERRRRGRRATFRSRRGQRLPGSEGRWSLFASAVAGDGTPTEKQSAIALLLIERYGVVTREVVAAEGVPGGFAGLYPIYKALEEAGRIRRGYFVAGQGAAQFAAAGADDRLRAGRQGSEAEEDTVQVLAATDPANPYGAVLSWPEAAAANRLQRVSGAKVILSLGKLIGYLNRSNQHLTTFLPEDPLERDVARAALLRGLHQIAAAARWLFLAQVDGTSVHECPLAPALRESGFRPSSTGYLLKPSAGDW